jgi:hypothetical protein
VQPAQGDYERLANEIKSLKSDWTIRLLVAGIFGWPLDDKPANATYKIDLIPNPNLGDTTHPTIWDTWPVCYDPNHQPAAATTDKTTGFDATAAGWGATPGLRMSAFVDEFNTNGVTNGLKYSICQPDFSAAMAGIGAAIAKNLQNLCVDYKLWKDDQWTARLPRGLSTGLSPMAPSKRTTEGCCRVMPRARPTNVLGGLLAAHPTRRSARMPPSMVN